MRFFGIALVLIIIPRMATARIVTRTIDYSYAGVVMQGYLAYDDSTDAARPGVLVAHAWMGLDEYTRARVRQLASMGYIAFALDMYGKGVRATNVAEARKLSGLINSDRRTMVHRAEAALEVLRDQPLSIDTDIAAIGFCFGGGVVMELARSGAALDGVVTFHGSVAPPDSSDASGIRARVLILHGAADPFVPIESVMALARQLEAARVDYRIILYGGAVHSFTEPDADGDPASGAAYDPVAAEASWKAMKRMFKDLWGTR